MKRYISNSMDDRRPFRYPDDVSTIRMVIDAYYDPTSFRCDDICGMLSEMFSNLVPVTVDFMLRNGEMQMGGHVVCKVKDGDAGDGCYLIDPTGDQFSGVIRGLECAYFNKNEFGYFSHYHKPENLYTEQYETMDEMLEDLMENYDDYTFLTI